MVLPLMLFWLTIMMMMVMMMMMMMIGKCRQPQKGRKG